VLAFGCAHLTSALTGAKRLRKGVRRVYLPAQVHLLN
jgi:hypothetical protein